MTATRTAGHDTAIKDSAPSVPGRLPYLTSPGAATAVAETPGQSLTISSTRRLPGAYFPAIPHSRGEAMGIVHYYLGRPARVWIAANSRLSPARQAHKGSGRLHSGIPGQPARGSTGLVRNSDSCAAMLFAVVVALPDYLR